MEPTAITQRLAAGLDRLTQRLEGCGLERSVVEAILSRHTLVRYPRGAMVFAQGAPADVIFAVLSGVIRVTCGKRADQRIIVTLAGPGDLAGFADFRDPRGGRSQLFNAEALTGVMIAIITRDHLGRALSALPSAAVTGLCEELNSFWAAALHRCVTLLGLSLRDRLEAVFTELAARFGVPDARGQMIPLDLAQQELAAMIGGSRPMVSKLLLDLTRDGFLVREGRHYILAGRSSPNPGRERQSALQPPPNHDTARREPTRNHSPRRPESIMSPA
jgi:CRP/FNR family cyclic AMP-dependent transcriptional regulator